MIGRIHRSADIERALASRPCHRTPHFALHHVPTLSQADLSTAVEKPVTKPVDDCLGGALVPKRHARRAATRNLVKRQVRAALQRHAAALAPGLWLVRLRAPWDRAAFPSAASHALRRAVALELDALLVGAAA